MIRWDNDDDDSVTIDALRLQRLRLCDGSKNCLCGECQRHRLACEDKGALTPAELGAKEAIKKMISAVFFIIAALMLLMIGIVSWVLVLLGPVQ